MQIQLLKAKIHQATVTGSNVEYQGSLTIDADLMDEVGILPYEKVLCSNIDNGNRFETYAIVGQRGSRDIILNGAAARLGRPGDRLTIMVFATLDAAEADRWQPRVLLLGQKNAIIEEQAT